MKDIALLFLLSLFISISRSINPYPNQNWESGLIDLGNGGDATFYALIRCKTCAKAPLLMWLTGGPGSSSLPTSYLEAGPYILNDDLKMEENPYSWTNKADVFWVDNPVGVPFSKAKNKTTLCKNENCIANNLYIFLVKFLEKHPEYAYRPFYIAGESYAGHYIPPFSALLCKINNPKINFIGVAIGNPWISSQDQTGFYSDFLYSNGNVSLSGYYFMKFVEIACKIIPITKVEAIDFYCYNYPIILASYFGIPFPQDITIDNPISIYKRFAWLDVYLNNTEVKKAFGVEGENFYSYAIDIYYALKDDMLVSYTDAVGYTLDHGKKMIFWFGDKDFTCNWMGGYNVVTQFPWKGKADFKNAKREKWNNQDGKTIGEMQKYKELTYIKVYGGGHSIFLKQQASAYQALKDLLEQP